MKRHDVGWHKPVAKLVMDDVEGSNRVITDGLSEAVDV